MVLEPAPAPGFEKSSPGADIEFDDFASYAGHGEGGAFHPCGSDLDRIALAVCAGPGFLEQVQQGYANRICTSLPSSLRIAWKRSFEAQALSGREIGGDDNVLNFFVGHLVDVDLARQPAA